MTYPHPFNGIVYAMDFGQLEMQCASAMEMAREKALADCMHTAAVKRVDVYIVYASERFGVPLENVTPAMRNVAKSELFARLYGGSARKMQR